MQSNWITFQAKLPGSNRSRSSRGDLPGRECSTRQITLKALLPGDRGKGHPTPHHIGFEAVAMATVQHSSAGMTRHGAVDAHERQSIAILAPTHTKVDLRLQEAPGRRIRSKKIRGNRGQKKYGHGLFALTSAEILHKIIR
ncbi:hypothetical protein Tdes44962_MAKER08486 [Teratosphaeria destructans]|uniref:Uncharacterized protein n=1 Tax=Teratosphaeria destructans TaxID=418781 RepID=A0A9W7SWH6_9PEZI|nr:hypothetical protein Tdes44962_MAKER08486 [Teratosphaeria destructans]